MRPGPHSRPQLREEPSLLILPALARAAKVVLFFVEGEPSIACKSCSSYNNFERRASKVKIVSLLVTAVTKDSYSGGRPANAQITGSVDVIAELMAANESAIVFKL